MNKQLLLAVTGLIAVASLFFFGRTVETKSASAKPGNPVQSAVAQFDITHFISDAKQKLTAKQLVTLGELENSVTRGDVHTQQIETNKQLANFWKDSVGSFEPYVYYLSASVKLENSEKNLTFAAQLILDDLRGEQDPAKLSWKTEQAIALFEQAIKLNPESDDLKIGLGSCYIYGKGRTAKPEETMKGIQQLLAVVKKDSTNMKAQLVLGVGGFVSGQYDKAVDRLTKVVKAEPGNLEAVAFLADAYASKGEKAEAIKWYRVMKQVANNAEYDKEIDQRIKMLQ